MTNEYNDLPEEEIIKLADDMIQKGFIVYFKWNCEKCKERVTCNTPNAFFTEGWVHEECGYKSFPDKYGLLVEKIDFRGLK